MHLVIDCLVNEWVKKLFNVLGCGRKDISQEKDYDYSKEDKQRIINELKLINSPTAIELAAKMQRELE